MGMIPNLFGLFFGSGRNVVKETVEALRPNAEALSVRHHTHDMSVLNQFAKEFHARQNRSWFDAFVDGLNRLPRPLMVVAVFGMLIYTPIDPVRMAEVFTAWALIPAGMWAVVGAIVAFFFGGRQQLKEHDFQGELAETLTRAPQVMSNLAALRKLRADSPGVADTGTDSALAENIAEPDENPALREWQESQRD
ncbi:3TM-type holin [Epibacterium ulvae]|uniref:3TM-type holin n=1 Tax=Epibacterium ulvae TaxID=1156985 RepID=UPI002490C5E7|nr:3TM-type holin [Epibacterium ulvae]